MPVEGGQVRVSVGVEPARGRGGQVVEGGESTCGAFDIAAREAGSRVEHGSHRGLEGSARRVGVDRGASHGDLVPFLKLGGGIQIADDRRVRQPTHEPVVRDIFKIAVGIVPTEYRSGQVLVGFGAVAIEDAVRDTWRATLHANGARRYAVSGVGAIESGADDLDLIVGGCLCAGVGVAGFIGVQRAVDVPGEGAHIVVAIGVIPANGGRGDIVARGWRQWREAAVRNGRCAVADPDGW